MIQRASLHKYGDAKILSISAVEYGPLLFLRDIIARGNERETIKVPSASTQLDGRGGGGTWLEGTESYDQLALLTLMKNDAETFGGDM